VIKEYLKTSFGGYSQAVVVKIQYSQALPECGTNKTGWVESASLQPFAVFNPLSHPETG
jgi:hypothetical protein